MSERMTWKKAIIKVLSDNGYPMRNAEIDQAIKEKNIYSPPKGGRTPEQTIREIITTSVREDTNSPFIIVEAGLYALRNTNGERVAALALIKKDKIDRPTGEQSPVKSEERKVQQYRRDLKVIAWVLQEAKGVCEGCKNVALFVDTYGDPYLEVHHVRQLSEKGSDRVENAVALCPNCHRRCHYSADKDKFKESLYQNIGRLVQE